MFYDWSLWCLQQQTHTGKVWEGNQEDWQWFVMLWGIWNLTCQKSETGVLNMLFLKKHLLYMKNLSIFSNKKRTVNVWHENLKPWFNICKDY